MGCTQWPFEWGSWSTGIGGIDYRRIAKKKLVLQKKYPHHSGNKTWHCKINTSFHGKILCKSIWINVAQEKDSHGCFKTVICHYLIEYCSLLGGCYKSWKKRKRSESAARCGWEARWSRSASWVCSACLYHSEIGPAWRWCPSSRTGSVLVWTGELSINWIFELIRLENMIYWDMIHG